MTLPKPARNGGFEFAWFLSIRYPASSVPHPFGTKVPAIFGTSMIFCTLTAAAVATKTIAWQWICLVVEHDPDHLGQSGRLWISCLMGDCCLAMRAERGNGTSRYALARR